jgi:hypothetical protein
VSLLGTTSIPPATAHEARERQELDLADQHPAVAMRTPRRPAQDEAPLDTAFRMLFCREARDEVTKGRLGRDGRQWLLVNGHRCQDDRLLFDAFGF